MGLCDPDAALNGPVQTTIFKTKTVVLKQQNV
jgi:hypothetical protein